MSEQTNEDAKPKNPRVPAKTLARAQSISVAPVEGFDGFAVFLSLRATGKEAAGSHVAGGPASVEEAMMTALKLRAQSGLAVQISDAALSALGRDSG